ncbi:MAG: coproporphyrinogen dehydrogenase HemZ [Clostridia bacterium]|nr:coproporphyrinogen dehydrogenase HemZ [Clostridia bacterium]NCD02159.1 coproporphyrinogen dehydrogenase HemZ [Clostridia bacterium]
MIYLLFNEERYENDIRALLMAFYHGEKILARNITNLEEKIYDYTPSDKILRVIYKGESVSLCLYDNQGKLLGEGCCEQLPKERKAGKDVLKICLYDVLSKVTGKELPWGTLTGIRPTKIPLSFYEEGFSRNEAAENLRKVYKTSEEKIQLCTQVAQNEKRILDSVDYKKSLSLYIGIPFCPTICLYCSFSAYPLNVWKKEVDNYLNALFKEIRKVSEMVKDYKLTSVYMGGGTPTSLEADQMNRLLCVLEQSFDLSTIEEFTIEAGRPDSVTMDKLRVIKAHGIERISINPQTLNQKTLDIIGRRHTVEDVENAFHMARQAGFNNINMDIILGLPGETAEDVTKTLEGIHRLNPESMTVHSLAVKRASRLNQNLELYPPAHHEEVNRMIHMAWKEAEVMGMEPYYLYRQKNIAGNLENVGYAKPGKECLYNILIMEEKQSIIALGAGGSSKIVIPEENRIERVENVKSVKDYIERIDEMIGRKMEKFPNFGIF